MAQSWQLRAVSTLSEKTHRHCSTIGSRPSSHNCRPLRGLTDPRTSCKSPSAGKFSACPRYSRDRTPAAAFDFRGGVAPRSELLTKVPSAASCTTPWWKCHLVRSDGRCIAHALTANNEGQGSMRSATGKGHAATRNTGARETSDRTGNHPAQSQI
jgi:hypothetical protein